MPDEFHTVHGVAALLKLNQQTIKNWIDPGEPHAVRIARRPLRVRRSDLDDFIAGGTTDRRESGADRAIVPTTTEGLAGLRSQLEAAAMTDDPVKVAELLAAITESARALAVSIRATSS